MDKLIIEGGQPLHGVITVNGSKNAALPILLASILLEGAQDFDNVPNLRDVLLPGILPGNLLVFPNAGAYAAALSPHGFAGHEAHGEVLV